MSKKTKELREIIRDFTKPDGTITVSALTLTSLLITIEELEAENAKE